MHNFLESFSDTNKFLNNTNTFLLDISLSLISYLLTKNDDFEEFFRRACWGNRRFASGSLTSDLLEKTNDFLLCMMNATEYIDCKCHDKTWTEFHQEIADPLHQYCLSLLQIVDEKDFSAKLITLSSDYGNDYIAIKNSLVESRIDLAQAERAVLCWQGAVSDTVMQESILQLRYDYLRKLIHTS